MQFLSFRFVGAAVFSARSSAILNSSCQRAAGFLVYQQLQSVGWVRAATKRRAPKRVPIGASNSAEPSQWLKGTFYDSHARAKVGGAQKGMGKCDIDLESATLTGGPRLPHMLQASPHSSSKSERGAGSSGEVADRGPAWISCIDFWPLFKLLCRNTGGCSDFLPDGSAH